MFHFSKGNNKNLLRVSQFTSSALAWLMNRELFPAYVASISTDLFKVYTYARPRCLAITLQEFMVSMSSDVESIYERPTPGTPLLERIRALRHTLELPYQPLTDRSWIAHAYYKISFCYTFEREQSMTPRRLSDNSLLWHATLYRAVETLQRVRICSLWERRCLRENRIIYPFWNWVPRVLYHCKLCLRFTFAPFGIAFSTSLVTSAPSLFSTWAVTR